MPTSGVHPKLQQAYDIAFAHYAAANHPSIAAIHRDMSLRTDIIVPSKPAIVAWRKKYDWDTKVLEMRRMAAAKAESLLTEHDIQNIIHIRQSAINAASLVARQLIEFLNDPERAKIKDWNDARLAKDIYAGLATVSENLAGGKADREADAATKAPDDMQQELLEKNQRRFHHAMKITRQQIETIEVSSEDA